MRHFACFHNDHRTAQVNLVTGKRAVFLTLYILGIPLSYLHSNTCAHLSLARETGIPSAHLTVRKTCCPHDHQSSLCKYTCVNHTNKQIQRVPSTDG